MLAILCEYEADTEGRRFKKKSSELDDGKRRYDAGKMDEKGMGKKTTINSSFLVICMTILAENRL